MSVDRRNLGERIGGATVTSKAAYEAKRRARSAGCTVFACCTHSRASRIVMDSACRSSMNATNRGSTSRGIMHLETQASAQREILLQGLTQGVHRTPPGHGRASGTQRADIHPGVDRGGLWALVAKDFADLGQRGAPLQHAHCQGVAKLV